MLVGVEVTERDWTHKAEGGEDYIFRRKVFYGITVPLGYGRRPTASINQSADSFMQGKTR